MGDSLSEYGEARSGAALASLSAAAACSAHAIQPPHLSAAAASHVAEQ